VLSPIVFANVLAIVLPGGAPVGMDYIAYDAANHRVWVPAGNTGNIDVIDTVSRKVTPISGFPTKPSTRPGRPAMGPSSASVAGKVVWVGNRGDNKVCSFDAATLAKLDCIQLGAMPDGVQFVAATNELWITTPREQTITIVNVDKKAVSGVIKLEGDPEGYALDGDRFYTNLEDKDRTLAIDIRTRKVLTNWPANCGAEGPRGLTIDAGKHQRLVACTDGVVALDEAHDGRVLGRLKTGKGVDDIAYVAARRLVYVASSEAGTLTIARLDDKGVLTQVATVPTAPGARNPVLDSDGNVYVPDSREGKLLVIPAQK
jgi:DNA-binding beta-propeller fold protein YncE